MILQVLSIAKVVLNLHKPYIKNSNRKKKISIHVEQAFWLTNNQITISLKPKNLFNSRTGYNSTHKILSVVLWISHQQTGYIKKIPLLFLLSIRKSGQLCPPQRLSKTERGWWKKTYHKGSQIRVLLTLDSRKGSSSKEQCTQ